MFFADSTCANTFPEMCNRHSKAVSCFLRLLLKAKLQQLETELRNKNRELSRMEEELNEKEVERKQLLNDVQELKVLNRSRNKLKLILSPYVACSKRFD